MVAIVFLFCFLQWKSIAIRQLSGYLTFCKSVQKKKKLIQF